MKKNFKFQIPNFKFRKLNISNAVSPIRKPAGFSLIEITIVVAAVSVLFALVSVNLLSVRGNADTNTTVATLTSDIRTQQLKAMVGETINTSTPVEYGIYFTPNSYTLFRGNTYSATNSANITVPLPQNITFTDIRFPGNQLIFTRGTGEVMAYSPLQNFVTLQSSLSKQTEQLLINRRGIVSEAN